MHKAEQHRRQPSLQQRTMCGVEVLACLVCGVAGGAAAKSKTKSLFGKKKQPDSPVLPSKQNGKWGLEEQEQWVRQEPVSIPHQQATPHSTQNNRELSMGQQQQQDWYSAALQQSAQLSDMSKQGESAHKDALLPDTHRQRSKAVRRRAAAGHSASHNEDWFSIALQQSAQLDHSGSRVQAGA